MKNHRGLRVWAAILVPSLFVPAAIAQEPQQSEDAHQRVEVVEGSSDVTFTIVEQMPQFPGGQDEMVKFIGSNIKYPQDAQEAGIEGAVYVTFVVEKDGSIGEARVLRGIGGGCDEEALRVIRAMPTWEPGVQRGKPVRVQYNLPIRYKLTTTEKK